MTTSIKRVVSSFILTGTATRDGLRIAVFHRCDTMPTFSSHWAACSGSIEKGETPFETASRELHEETNLSSSIPNEQYGLYVDVPFRKTEERETIIRVYPFTVQLPSLPLELRGTEHDYHKFISVQELEELEPAVPSLARAFHHATCGRYLKDVSADVLEWANDHANGAATMARNALHLVKNHNANPEVLLMRRPSMVAITNSLNRVIDGESVDVVLHSLDAETSRAADFAVDEIQPLLQDKTAKNPLVIGTFSRSSTLVAILQQLMNDENTKSIRVICSKSTPGNEGVLMAKDLGGVECVDDEELLNRIRQDEIDVILVGSDCVTETSVVNKIGTKRLAEAAGTSSRAKVFCCTDRFKAWNDIFPPPLEDIFEEIPVDLFDKILMPPPLQECEAE